MNLEERQAWIDKIGFPVNDAYSLDGLVPSPQLAARLDCFRKACPSFFMSGTKFLDVGCSRGFFSLLMLRDNPNIEKIVGIDIRGEVIGLCRELLPEKSRFVDTSFRDLEIEETYDRIFIGNGPHHLYKDAGESHDWIKKLVVLSTDLVLLEGGFEFNDGDKQFEVEITSALGRKNFTQSSFYKQVAPYFSVEKWIASVIPGRYVVVLKRKECGIDKVLFLSQLPIRRVMRLGCRIHSTLFQSEYGGVSSICKISTYKFNPFSIKLTSLSPWSSDILHFVEYSNEIVGWSEPLLSNYSSPLEWNYCEILKLFCKHQIYLVRNGYFNEDIHQENCIEVSSGKFLVVDKDQVLFLQKTSADRLNARWMGWLTNLNISQELISKLFVEMELKDSRRVEGIFKVILNELTLKKWEGKNGK